MAGLDRFVEDQPPLLEWLLLVGKLRGCGTISRTTHERMPCGEAEHYRNHAVELGTSADAIFIELKTRNTEENIRFSRALLEQQNFPVSFVLLVSEPYEVTSRLVPEAAEQA